MPFTRKSVLSACLPFIFFYLLLQGCSQPNDTGEATHFDRVPRVLELQGALSTTPTGKRLILVTWKYDTQNSNIRSWDLTRSLRDTAAAAYVPLEIILKPSSGFPSYRDSSASIQNDAIVGDSLDVYYRIIPNGNDNFVGRPSNVLHIVIRK